MWIEPSTGTVLKTYLVAADPEVRAQVTVTMRHDDDGRVTCTMYRRFSGQY